MMLSCTFATCVAFLLYTPLSTVLLHVVVWQTTSNGDTYVTYITCDRSPSKVLARNLPQNGAYETPSLHTAVEILSGKPG